ncbi:MAG: DUF1801 domain-containing protein [Polyangiales bacterium]
MDVDAFLTTLTHARIAEVRAVRAAIRAAVPTLTERVKWNAPSFCAAGDDRITFRLQPGDRVELIFHRGAKKRADDFRFDDATGLVKWAAPDRGQVVFRDAADVAEKTPAVQSLARAWIAATT